MSFAKLSLRPRLKLKKSNFGKAPARRQLTSQLQQRSPNLLQLARLLLKRQSQLKRRLNLLQLVNKKSRNQRSRKHL